MNIIHFLTALQVNTKQLPKQFDRDTCPPTISVGTHLRQTDEFRNSESVGARRIAQKTYQT